MSLEMIDLFQRMLLFLLIFVAGYGLGYEYPKYKIGKARGYGRRRDDLKREG